MAVEQYAALIAAGGAGKRFGKSGKLRNKLGGKSLFSHSLDLFDGDERCSEVLVCASPELKEWIAGDPLTFSSTKLKLVDAADNRAQSVVDAATQAAGEVIVIQNASNPNAGMALVDRLLATVKPEIGAVPAISLPGVAAYVTSTKSDGGGPADAMEDLLGPRADHRMGHLMEHPDGEGLMLIQVPQAFYRASFLDAAGKAGELMRFSDDSALYLAGGFEVAAIPGHTGNLPVHTEGDFKLLAKLMGTGPRKKDKYTGLGW
jgi:2-C-methyl-D-erythritol 4-phosphate cytidylyltransferase